MEKDPYANAIVILFYGVNRNRNHNRKVGAQPTPEHDRNRNRVINGRWE